MLRELGAGAMGAIYLASDELLGREVAVKTIRGYVSAGSGRRPSRACPYEARTMAALSHPNIVRVFDLGVEGDTPFLVMELASGQSLEERLQAVRRLSLDEGAGARDPDGARARA